MGDGASVNDVMTTELAPSFRGMPCRIWCFLHVLNLVSKVILGQFDNPKERLDATVTVAEEALRDLMEGLDIEGDDEEDEEDDVDDIDEGNVHGWINEHMDLSEEEREALKVEMEPVKRLLLKVSLTTHLDTPLPQPYLHLPSSASSRFQ